MGLLFRKRIKLIPGIYINVARKGLSVSAGVRGARVTIGKDRTTTSVGLPGTGLSSRTVTRHPRVPVAATEPLPKQEATPAPAGITWRFWVVTFVMLFLVLFGVSLLGA